MLRWCDGRFEVRSRCSRFCYKENNPAVTSYRAGQIGPKVFYNALTWDRSGIFSDKISLHLGSVSSSLLGEPKCAENSRICPFCSQTELLYVLI